MKKKLLLLIICITPFILLAQESETEAMAAYMLAEESYASGDYASSLKFLEESEEKLGNTNSKLLYLKIQIQSELYKNDKSYYDKIIKTISDFQSGLDINNFNQDKVLEVVKMKMAMENKKEEEIRMEAKSKKDKEEREANFRNFGFEGWPFNVDIENLKYPDRELWFTKLCHTEWTVDEIAQSQPFLRLQVEIEKFFN
jgi:phage/plasmid-associated DNA primase